jgi:type II secretory pathway pseudopilin PulG
MELVVALAIVSLAAGIAVPITADSVDAGRARQAAGFVAARFHLARQRALFTARVTGLVFERAGDRWTFRVCEDGNGDGLRRAEIQTGEDACVEGPYDLTDMFPGVRAAIDPALPGPDDGVGAWDAVKFGMSDIASFSPEGGGTAGTLFLRSPKGRQFAIRVSNVTGRTRVLRYDMGTRAWIAA